ncbi:competence/damage-inducible protein A [Azohydromonas caseinilytica]|uniref:Competence/damage-inducible protein A n=1 Tax=Azohydromonas caseinilytica TaxID=2728836 RepID=A0A848F6Q1_9BURK|nr:molybdopterin-binding protein [Azohydromonas caseinilytica]NML14386.1 competence/damage-inducible protein A [Azohydromonas caseinilytica]
MNFGLIVIGDEILSGKRQDRHMAKAIELLGARGLQLSWARYLGDERAQIAAALRQAFDSGDAVFSCGGIGATPDDHTRQAAAAALGVPLELHPEARELITQRMREMAAERGEAFDPRHPDNLQRLHMGEFPRGARIVPNPYNRIPGFSVGEVHFLPGFPVMAHPMMERLLDTRYAALHGTQRQRERSFIVLGAMEATLTPLMEAIEAAHDSVRVFSLPSVDHPQWGRHVELGVKGPAGTVDAAFEALRAGLAQLQIRVGTEMVR